MKEKPYAYALLTGFIAVVVVAGLGVWAQSSPERVIIGVEGRHDGPSPEARLATCLDCHVPFVGTPGSRCLAPGCHSELATGTPPRDGPVMPIRFHVALRDRPCSLCHVEHGRDPMASQTATGTTSGPSTFDHQRIPEDARTCGKCHRGVGIPAHPSTNSVACDLCHATDRWTGVFVDHRRVASEPCDLCHVAPTKGPHASIAGTCSECHETTSWKANVPRPSAPAQPPAK